MLVSRPTLLVTIWLEGYTSLSSRKEEEGESVTDGKEFGCKEGYCVGKGVCGKDNGCDDEMDDSEGCSVRGFSVHVDSCMDTVGKVVSKGNVGIVVAMLDGLNVGDADDMSSSMSIIGEGEDGSTV